MLQKKKIIIIKTIKKQLLRKISYTTVIPQDTSILAYLYIPSWGLEFVLVYACNSGLHPSYKWRHTIVFSPKVGVPPMLTLTVDVYITKEHVKKMHTYVHMKATTFHLNCSCETWGRGRQVYSSPAQLGYFCQNWWKKHDSNELACFFFSFCIQCHII